MTSSIGVQPKGYRFRLQIAGSARIEDAGNRRPTVLW
jgi:hypothetical protein